MAPSPNPSRKPTNGPTTTDPRFSTFQTDPRYRLPKKKDTHVKVDKRFASMLEDDDFSSKAKVDRYGRKISKAKTSMGKKQLERLYDFDFDDVKAELRTASDEDNDAAEELERGGSSAALDAKYVGFDESSSSEEDESSSEEEESEEEDAAAVAGLEGYGGEEDDDIPMGDVTARLAVVNLDWDHIRAVDLMAVAQSFCPSDGKVEKVTVYPSEFGRERMEREEFEGPPKELFKIKTPKREVQINGGASSPKRNKELFYDSNLDAHSSSSEEELLLSDSEAPSSDGEAPDDAEIKHSLLRHAAAPEAEIDTKALRAYQLSRLRYYYAIVTCSNPTTAHALYKSMDGREYLSTANFFDMRFVPNETTFDDKSRDICLSVPSGYKPADFVTEALTHSHVRLTWDEEDRGRKEAQKRVFTKRKDGKIELDEDSLKAYIGSDSDSGSDDEDAKEITDAAQLLKGISSPALKSAEPTKTKQRKSDKARQKMRLALGLTVDEPQIKKSKSKSSTDDSPALGNMQITFSSALSSSKADKPKPSIFENTLEDVKEETTKERYVRKEKERKARRKEKVRLERGGSPEAQSQLQALETSESRAGVEEVEEDPFNDPFFTDPQAANAAARAAAKKAKREVRAIGKAAEAERIEKEKKQLEALMVDERAGEEFDMSEVKKAEKAARVKSKGSRREREREVGEKEGKKGGFKIDVADPRFKSVYEDFEYAIDPSNPRFSGTEGMKRLLEEGRRKRKQVGEAAEGDGKARSSETKAKKVKK